MLYSHDIEKVLEWKFINLSAKFPLDHENKALQYITFYNKNQVILKNYSTNLVEDLSD